MLIKVCCGSWCYTVFRHMALSSTIKQQRKTLSYRSQMLYEKWTATVQVTDSKHGTQLQVHRKSEASCRTSKISAFKFTHHGNQKDIYIYIYWYWYLLLIHRGSVFGVCSLHYGHCFKSKLMRPVASVSPVRCTGLSGRQAANGQWETGETMTLYI